MSTLSPKQAIAEISDIKDLSISTTAKLKKFNETISRIEPGPEVTNRKFTFWSGGFSPTYKSQGSDWDNISSNVASTALANQSDQVGIIKDTNYAAVLMDKNVRSDYFEIQGLDRLNPKHKEAIAEAKTEYASGLYGPWGQASQSLAENVRGDVLAFSPFETGKTTQLENGEQISKSNNIFTEREFPTLLDNKAVNSINGIPAEQLRRMRDDPSLGIDAARHEVNLASRDYIKGLHVQQSRAGDKLCFNKEFLDKHSLKERKNFQEILDKSNPDHTVVKNSQTVEKEQRDWLHSRYKDGNPLNAEKENKIQKEQNADLKKIVESNHGIKAFDSRSGKYEGKVLESNQNQVAQQVGKHAYVHKMNAKDHDLQKGDFAKIRTSKGVVQSIEKKSLDVKKSKDTNLKKHGPSKGFHR